DLLDQSGPRHGGIVLPAGASGRRILASTGAAGARDPVWIPKTRAGHAGRLATRARFRFQPLRLSTRNGTEIRGGGLYLQRGARTAIAGMWDRVRSSLAPSPQFWNGPASLWWMIAWVSALYWPVTLGLAARKQF